MQPTMTTRPVSPRIQALKVLIVDDEHYMRKVTRTILTAIGVKTILEAPDGMAGLELARTQLPHLLIIDWEMPVIDGAQLVRMIRTPGEFPAPDVPIIMLSAHSDHRRVVESARIGANEFVRKPVSIKTLEGPYSRGHQPAPARLSSSMAITDRCRVGWFPWKFSTALRRSHKCPPIGRYKMPSDRPEEHSCSTT
jgi:CheY-like chemotaxis protein